MASMSRTGPSVLRKAKAPQRQCLCYEPHTRPFSSTSHRSAATTRRLDLSRIAPKQQSVSARVKQMKRSEMPTDIGLIPGTFIRPTWNEGPSLFSPRWRERLFMDWYTIKQNFVDFAGTYILYRWNSTNPETGQKIKIPLGLRDRSKVAYYLHQTLYDAIAKGDKRKIKDIACSGLAQQQSARIDSRKLNDLPKENWACVYKGSLRHAKIYWPLQFLVPNKAVKVVADRQVALPFGENASIRQFTVRIKSRQFLDKGDGSLRTSKDLVEYLVVQRMIIDGETLDWKVWGTTKPSTYQDALDAGQPLEGAEEKSPSYWESIKMTFYDKIGKRISDGKMNV